MPFMAVSMVRRTGITNLNTLVTITPFIVETGHFITNWQAPKRLGLKCFYKII